MAERRWFSRSSTPEPQFGSSGNELVLRTGLAALSELEVSVSDTICCDRRIDPASTRPDAASALGAAGGLAATGRRVACFVDGTVDAPLVGRLRALAERRLPLVVYVVTHDSATIEGLCATECSVAVARSPAHALDLALVARHAAEASLTPAVIALDRSDVARSFQTLRTLPDDLVRHYLGRPDDLIDAPTAAQRMLLGPERRRIPRWFDPLRPAAHGLALPQPEQEAAALGRRVFFDAELTGAVGEAARRYEELTGRDLGPADLVAPRRYDDLLVTQGSMVELAVAVVAATRRRGGGRIAVLGMTWRRPLPAEVLLESARRAARVLVFERTPPAGSVRPPLAREVKAMLPPDGPPVHSAVHGKLSADELAGALLDKNWEEIVLGMTAPGASSGYPRREVMLGRIRRDYPRLSRLTRAPAPVEVEASSPNATSMALYLRADVWPEAAITELLEQLRPHLGDRVRSTVERVEGALWRLQAVFSDKGGVDPLVAPLDLLLIADPDHVAEWDALREVQARGKVVLASAQSAIALTEALPARWIERVRELPLTLVRVPAGRSLSDRLIGLTEAALALCEGSDEELEKLDPGERTLSREGLTPTELPVAVRRLGTVGETYDNLARFWSEFDEPRRAALERAVPDPYLSLGGVPPCTAGLSDNTTRRETLPWIDAARCDGCGECWIDCPDSAIGATAIGIVDLLDRLGAGFEPEGDEADTVGRLRRAHRQIGGRIERLLSGAEATSLSAEVVGQAFDWALGKLGLEDDALETARRYRGALLEALASSPLSVTERFFDGRRELLALAVNPQSCQGCGVCAFVCPRDAIDVQPQTLERIDAMRGRWKAWEALPADDDAVAAESLSDVLMSRTALFSVIGGAESEPGSGSRIAVRQVAAVATHAGARRRASHEKDLDETIERLRETIREELARGVDVEDLGRLEAALDRLPGAVMDLAGIAGEAGGTARVAARRVQELVHVARDLEQERTARAGATVAAGLGFVVAGGAAVEWAARFPRNPFGVPVRVDLSDDAVDTAAGLVEGLLAERWEDARRLRLARVALESPDSLRAETTRLERGDRRMLTEGEAALAPRVVVLVGSDVLDGPLRAGVERVLAGDLPLKIVMLDELDRDSPAADLLLRTLDRGRAAVLSTSIAHPDHSLPRLSRALEIDGPALVRIHAPSPRRHGFHRDRAVERARLAVESRVAPLMWFDPTPQDGAAPLVSLAGNPDPAADWAVDGQGNERRPSLWSRDEHRIQDQEFLAGTRGLTAPSVPGPNGEDPASGEIRTSGETAQLDRRCEEFWRALRERAASPSEPQAESEAIPPVERLHRKLMELAGYGDRARS